MGLPIISTTTPSLPPQSFHFRGKKASFSESTTEAEEAFRAVDFDKGNHKELDGVRRPVSADPPPLWTVPSLLRALTATMSLPMSAGVPVTGSPRRTRALSSSSLYPQHLARNPAPSKRSRAGSSSKGTDSGQTCPSGYVQGQVLWRQL